MKQTNIDIKNCSGIVGKLFGHEFVSYKLEKGEPNRGLLLDGSYSTNDLIELYECITPIKYSIRCKRCGQQKEVNNERID